MMLLTRALNSSVTEGWSFKTLETVPVETPASLATSRIPTFGITEPISLHFTFRTMEAPEQPLS